MADYDFLFFGAGDAAFYETMKVIIDFESEPSEEEKFAIDQSIPVALQDDVEWEGTCLTTEGQWLRTSVREMFPDPHQTDDLTAKQVGKFLAETERWLKEVHAIAPIHAVFRTVDATSGGTKFSHWHEWSLDRLDSFLEKMIASPDHPLAAIASGPLVSYELERGRAISETLRKVRHLGSILTDTIYQRDEQALDLRFRDLTSDDLSYITNHTPGGLNESLFCVSDRFLGRDDVPQKFWDAIGRATEDSFGVPDERGERATKVWRALAGKTETHLSAPYLRAMKTGDPKDVESALELVPEMSHLMCIRLGRLQKEDDRHFEFLKAIAKTAFDPERAASTLFRVAAESVSARWTFTDRDPKLDELVETMRDASYWQDESDLNRLGATAYNAMTSGRFGEALCLYYIICPHQEIHSSAQCNALYAVQVDNNHEAHQPEIARKLLDDCLKRAPINLDIYYNAIAVWMELGEIDEAFETLNQLIPRAISYDYDLDKVENEPFFESLHDDPRWKKAWG